MRRKLPAACFSTGGVWTSASGQVQTTTPSPYRKGHDRRGAARSDARGRESGFGDPREILAECLLSAPSEESQAMGPSQTSC